MKVSKTLLNIKQYNYGTVWQLLSCALLTPYRYIGLLGNLPLFFKAKHHDNYGSDNFTPFSERFVPVSYCEHIADKLKTFLVCSALEPLASIHGTIGILELVNSAASDSFPCLHISVFHIPEWEKSWVWQRSQRANSASHWPFGPRWPGMSPPARHTEVSKCGYTVKFLLTYNNTV